MTPKPVRVKGLKTFADKLVKTLPVARASGVVHVDVDAQGVARLEEQTVTEDEDEELRHMIEVARRALRKADAFAPRDVVTHALFRAVELLAGQLAADGKGSESALDQRWVKDFLDGLSPEVLATLKRPRRQRSRDGQTHAAERDQFRDATKLIETSQGTHPNKLVERLVEVVSRATQAVFAELANMPCELPTVDDVVHAYDSKHVPGGYLSSEAQRDASRIVEMVRTRLAPVLAAKDAEIGRQQQVIRLQNKIAKDCASRAAHESTIAALVAEAERDAEKMRAIRVEREQQAERIAELMARHEDLVTGIKAALGQTESHDGIVADVAWAVEELGRADEAIEWRKKYVAMADYRIAELEKQLVGAVDVDGARAKPVME